MKTRGRLRAEGKRITDEDCSLQEKRKARKRSTSQAGSSTTVEQRRNAGLLPGIPDHITTHLISPKLPWNTFFTLSLVSRNWQAAVQSREMFSARILSRSTDKFVVINHALSATTYGIALYSLRTKAWFHLRPIPGVKTGIPDLCECITLDGKIYLLGGLRNSHTLLAHKEVYMLDVAGPGQWKKCASMQTARWQFGCSVLNGKIYVCGGTSRREPVTRTEVYDPKADVWTTIKPARYWRIGHQVGAVEGELMVYDGMGFNENFRRIRTRFDHDEFSHTRAADHVEFYNPITDTWRALYHSSNRVFQKLFLANGRLHSLSKSDISIHDLEGNSKSPCHSISSAREELKPPDGRIFPPCREILVDDDLLVTLELWPNIHYDGNERRCSIGLLLGRGFGIKNQEIEWERAPCSLLSDSLWSPFLRLLEL